MGRFEAIRFEGGINPLDYTPDPDSKQLLGVYDYVLGIILDDSVPQLFDREGRFNQTREMNDEYASLFCRIGETLAEAGLPAVHTTLWPNVPEKPGYLGILSGTNIAAAVQTQLYNIANVYSNSLKPLDYSDQRRQELVDEFVLRCVGSTQATMASTPPKIA